VKNKQKARLSVKYVRASKSLKKVILTDIFSLMENASSNGLWGRQKELMRAA
jgi:hypothetical protein